MLTITAIYTGLSALLLVALSALVIRERARAHVSLGDGGDARLEKAIRAQGNFVEYTPLALIVLALAEMQGAPAVALHIMGSALVIGRVLHGWGLTRERSLHPARGLGMVLTFAVLLVGGAGLVVHALL